LPHSLSLRRIVQALFVLVPLAFGAIALLLGQDSNWDLRNYHWYDAYAALTGRLDQDMGPAQTPTYYNPTLDIPFYLAANALPARVFSFLLGALQGCNFILLYLIAARTLRLADERLHVLACALIAAVGVIGAGNLALVGAVFYDNVISLFVFGAVLVILMRAERLEAGPWPPALRAVLLAGFLVGCAVGLKLPSQMYAVGVCFALLFVPGPFWRRFTLSFVCGLGVIAGFALFGGWWLAELITRFGNPLFPYFNDIIRSPWALPEPYRDDRFFITGLGDALTLPFQLFVDGQQAGEIQFRDARVLAAYVVLFATPVMLFLGRLRTQAYAPVADLFALRYLAAFFGLSYLVWLGLFVIYRYAVPLEMIAPLIVVAAMAVWPISAHRHASLAIAVLGFCVVTVKAGTWGRMPWSESGKFVEVTAPDVPTDSLILMTGFAPTSFVIPAFPREVSFLRPQSYLVEPTHDTRFTATIRDRIKDHAGPVYLLQPTWEGHAGRAVLPQFGLEPTPDCRPVRTNLDDELELCAVVRRDMTGSIFRRSGNRFADENATK
jgi:hypothetical protein